VEPLLEISGLTVDYTTAGGSTVCALSDVSLQVFAHEIIGVLGESGSGKTTMGLSALRLLPANAAIRSGRIRLRGRNLLDLREKDLAKVRGAEISHIFQEPAQALNPVLSAGRQISYVLRAHKKLSNRELIAEVHAMLALVGFNDPERIARAYPHQLSGGQRQRVAIAQALACRPAVLIADEPLSSLDAATQAETLALLQRLRSEIGLAILFISHDADTLAAFASRTVVMEKGTVVAGGSIQELRSNSSGYVRALISPGASLKAPTPAEEAAGTPLLSVRNLTKRYVQRQVLSRRAFIVEALSGVSLELNRGATVALIGKSGAGKSTLARCIAGFETPDAGEMLLDGFPLRNLKRQMRWQVQMIFQDAAGSLNPRFTAERLITEPLDILGRGTKAERRRRALNLLEEVGLDLKFADRLPAELSGGQRQRIAIARALAVDPKLLILDEAFSGLDRPRQARIGALLQTLQQRHGFACLHISHDVGFASLLASEILVMGDGRIAAKFSSEEIRNSRDTTALMSMAVDPGSSRPEVEAAP